MKEKCEEEVYEISFLFPELLFPEEWEDYFVHEVS